MRPSAAPRQPAPEHRVDNIRQGLWVPARAAGKNSMRWSRASQLLVEQPVEILRPREPSTRQLVPSFTFLCSRP